MDILYMFQTHLPGYIDGNADLARKGIQVVACVSVNDPFVMDAWGKAQGADGKVRSSHWMKMPDNQAIF